MHHDTIAWLGIDQLHQGLDRGDWNVAELTRLFLERIEQSEDRLHAYSVVWPERALARAEQLDAAAREGEPLGALHGVPVALKDLCDVAGEPTRAGTVALGSEPASTHAEVVDRLEAAGAIILGKVKMTEGAFISHHPSVVPPVNPWNPERWTGISSSGSGVSVAAGLCTAALGTDTGGSIRYPSAACGLAGLKPTHGRISLRGVYPLAESLDHIGPMARSVDDVARLFSVLVGHDPGDPWSLAHNPAVATISALDPKLSGVRIGFDPGYCEEGVEPSIRAVVREAMRVLGERGAEIVEVTLPSLDEALGSWQSIAGAEIAAAHAVPFQSRPDDYGKELRAMIEQGAGVDGRAVAEAWRARIAFARRLEARFDEVDVLIAPIIPDLFAANTNLADIAETPSAVVALRFTSPFNLSGSPSLTLPGGFDRDGAPIGFQLVGPHGDESRLLAMGAAYQRDTDWHLRHPTLE